MKVTAIRNFLHNGQHVASGSALELESGAAQRLITAKRVIITPAEEVVTKPAKGAKK